jgi:hypothetical protein
MNILIIVCIMTVISVIACRWARKSMINLERGRGQRASAKIVKMSEEMSEEMRELLDYKMDINYTKTKKSC